MYWRSRQRSNRFVLKNVRERAFEMSCDLDLHLNGRRIYHYLKYIDLNSVGTIEFAGRVLVDNSFLFQSFKKNKMFEYNKNRILHIKSYIPQYPWKIMEKISNVHVKFTPDFKCTQTWFFQDHKSKPLINYPVVYSLNEKGIVKFLY